MIDFVGIGVDDYFVPWIVIISMIFIYHSIALIFLSTILNPVTGVVGGELLILITLLFMLYS